MAEYVLAMKHGLGLNKILGTIHTYPTLAEANKFAAGVWKKAHAPEKLLELGSSEVPRLAPRQAALDGGARALASRPPCLVALLAVGGLAP